MAYIIDIDNENGLAVPEGKILSTAAHLVEQIAQGMPICSIGQSSLVDAIRLAVVQKSLSDVKFRFNGELIDVSPYGTLTRWPRGFPGDVQNQILRGLITAQSEAVKKYSSEEK